MHFLAVAILPALLIWVAIALARGSVYLTVALMLTSSICFPAEFLAYDAGGLTWTLDRLWFAVLILQAFIQWCRGELRMVRLELCDVALAMLLVWMVLRTITQPLGSQLPEQPPTLMRLVNGYGIPFTLYGVLRCCRLEPDKLKPVGYLLAGVVVYLAVTAWLEVSECWSLVFPGFISDPDVGIHFGRARGPMLQSVRLGVCLVAGWFFLAIYTVWLKPTCRFRWFIFAAGSLLLMAAIFFTYTRSVWLGAAFAMATLCILATNGTPRRVAVFGMLTTTVLVLSVAGSRLISFERESSAAETRQSTYMRAAFAYVSLEMFKDRPVAGFGFNQFQVYSPPYIADRSTNLHLESIRGYVHHNGFLSILVELGLIGLGLYATVTVTLARQSWLLWTARHIPPWVRGLALANLAVGGCHLLQMAFHEMSFSPIENGLILSLSGLIVAASQQYCLRPLGS